MKATQSSLFPDHVPDAHSGYDLDDFTSDDWETPDPVALKIASLVLPTDKRIIEPAAGTGQIAKFLPTRSNPRVKAIELKPGRCTLGAQKAPNCDWYNEDFFSLARQFEAEQTRFDLFTGNPPFSLGMKFYRTLL
jgi:predicted RNA methylase